MAKKQASLADLRVDDEVEVHESYPGALFSFRGKVHETDGDCVVIGGVGYVRSVLVEVEGRLALKVSVEQPDPPAARGAVVKYYDPNYLEYRAAHHDGETGWYDLSGGGPVDLEGRDWTVLFDPRRDA